VPMLSPESLAQVSVDCCVISWCCSVCEVDQYVRRFLYLAKNGDTANMRAVTFVYTIQVSCMGAKAHSARRDTNDSMALTLMPNGY
jgi:hypothetical protein